MIELLWVIICFVFAFPLIVTPNKVVERPGCKIKSPVVVRILGVLVALVGVVLFIF